MQNLIRVGMTGLSLQEMEAFDCLDQLSSWIAVRAHVNSAKLRTPLHIKAFSIEGCGCSQPLFFFLAIVSDAPPFFVWFNSVLLLEESL